MRDPQAAVGWVVAAIIALVIFGSFFRPNAETGGGSDLPAGCIRAQSVDC